MSNTLQSKSNIKAWYETGDVPSESQFNDWITTMVAEGGNTGDISGAIQVGNTASSTATGAIAIGNNVSATNVSSTVYGLNGINNDSYSLMISKDANTSIRLMALPPISPKNGDIWRGTDNYLYARINGVTSNIGAIGSFGITVDGGGSAVTTGSKGFVTIPYNATITNWYMAADQSGSIVIDVKRSATSIVGGGGNKPTLVSASNATNAVSSWTSNTITAGDILEFNVDSCTTITNINLVLKVIK